MSNFIVSARKYRPARFADVVGQEHITNTLKNAIRNNHLAHSFLFTGPRGVGKTTCARILAKTINCENLGPDTEACNECESCRSFNNSNSFNIHELDAASNNSVEDIRALTDQVRFAPASGKYKIYIIDEVHMLSQQAFNAFLKTLEEPPYYAIFILATTEKNKIIPTILSRCQIFDFKRISVEGIVAQLDAICSSESISADSNAMHLIAQKADGGLRDALSMFDRLVTFAGNSLSLNDVLTNLNILDYDYYFKATEQILEGDAPGALTILDKVLRSGFEGDDFMLGLADHLRNLFVLKDLKTASLLEVSGALRQRYEDQAILAPINIIVNALRICNDCDIQYKSAKNKRLLVELSIMKMCYIKEAIKVVSRPPAAEEAKKKITPAEENNAAEKIAETTDPPKAAPKQITAPVVSHQAVSSLSDLEAKLRAQKEAMKVVAVKEEIIPTAVDEEKAKELIATFAENMRQSGNVGVAGMLESAPCTVEFNKLQFAAASDIQKTLIEKEMPTMLDFLRREMSNPSILAEVLVDEVQSKSRNSIFTAKDKLDAMIRNNPNVQTLIEKLGLDLEY